MQQRIPLSMAGLLLAAGCAYAEKGYVIRDLGNFGALISASVDAMNDRGQMAVNTTSSPGFVYRAYIIDGSKRTPLPEGTRANGINSYGDVVGSITVNGKETAFLYKNGSLTTLEPLLRANAINDRGQIVGVGPGKYRLNRAVLLQNGTITELGPNASERKWDSSAAVAINERGRIAAFTYINDWTPDSWYWENGVERHFDAIVPPTVTAMNESGTLVGFTNRSQEVADCFHWLFTIQNGVFRVLPLPGKAGTAAAINDAGTIAGTMSSGMFCATRAGDITSAYVLEADGDFTALPPLAPGAYSSARAINNRGQVGGAASMSSGGSHAVFWERR